MRMIGFELTKHKFIHWGEPDQVVVRQMIKQIEFGDGELGTLLSHLPKDIPILPVP